MTQLHADRFLLRPFTAADAPSFAEAVRESMASVGQWMNWAHAAYSTDEALSCASARARHWPPSMCWRGTLSVR